MKIPRNAACPCGSGRKYKKCCGLHAEGERSSALAPERRAAARLCAFDCRAECAEVCCGGATLITIDEIRICYDLFPISVGFRKHTPLDRSHRDLLGAAGIPWRGRFIVGDFIAGNRHAPRCSALDSANHCSLHGTGKKPAQCRLVPFSALYPEGRQDVLFGEQRKGKFAKCRGFVGRETGGHIVWREGRFVDQAYSRAYHDFQQGALSQAALMGDILEGMKAQEAYGQFLAGEGILEAPIPAALLPRVFEAAGLPVQEHRRYVEAQWRLCRREGARTGWRNSVLEDCARELERCRAQERDGAQEEDIP
jgi:hypothetical protein